MNAQDTEPITLPEVHVAVNRAALTAVRLESGELTMRITLSPEGTVTMLRRGHTGATWMGPSYFPVVARATFRFSESFGLLAKLSEIVITPSSPKLVGLRKAISVGVKLLAVDYSVIADFNETAWVDDLETRELEPAMQREVYGETCDGAWYIEAKQLVTPTEQTSKVFTQHTQTVRVLGQRVTIKTTGGLKTYEAATLGGTGDALRGAVSFKLAHLREIAQSLRGPVEVSYRRNPTGVKVHGTSEAASFVALRELETGVTLAFSSPW